MSRGLALRMALAPSPKRSMAPGRKFCSTTSAEAISACTGAKASGFFRSTHSERLPRLQAKKPGGRPLRPVAMRRISSPAGDSTLMTSAPWSASMAAATGPDTMVVKSTTRTPSSGPAIRPPFRGKSSQPPDGKRLPSSQSRAGRPPSGWDPWSEGVPPRRTHAPGGFLGARASRPRTARSASLFRSSIKARKAARGDQTRRSHGQAVRRSIANPKRHAISNRSGKVG